MNKEELQVCEVMASVGKEYFPELEGVTYTVEAGGSDAIEAKVGVSRDGIEVMLRYGDSRVLEYRYRLGLVSVIAHELAHLLNPVDPEQVMRKRLPAAMMVLWNQLVEEGHAVCSMRRRP